MKKAFILLLTALAFSVPASAAIEVQEDGTQEGRVTAINLSTGLDGSRSGGTYTITTAAAQTATSVTATGAVTGAQVVATEGLYLPYYSKLTRPASGADKGTVITMGGANSNDCGTAGSGTTFNVCVSNGTNWIPLN